MLPDTQILIRWINGDSRLSRQVMRTLMDESQSIYLSPICFVEMAIKQTIGKLDLPMPLQAVHDTLTQRLRAIPLPVNERHAFALAELPLHHRDPFDRLLIAQAVAEKMTILSLDSRFDAYGVSVIN